MYLKKKSMYENHVSKLQNIIRQETNAVYKSILCSTKKFNICVWTSNCISLEKSWYSPSKAAHFTEVYILPLFSVKVTNVYKLSEQ